MVTEALGLQGDDDLGAVVADDLGGAAANRQGVNAAVEADGEEVPPILFV